MFSHSEFCSNHINDQTNKKNVINLKAGLHTLNVIHLIKLIYNTFKIYEEIICDYVVYTNIRVILKGV